MIICSAINERQLHAIADEIDKQLKKLSVKKFWMEGYRETKWLLIDYGDVSSTSLIKRYEAITTWNCSGAMLPGSNGRIISFAYSFFKDWPWSAWSVYLR
jgi:hypothetical protein